MSEIKSQLQSVREALEDCLDVLGDKYDDKYSPYLSKVCNEALKTLTAIEQGLPEVVKDMDLIHEIYNEENEYMISMSSGDVVRYIAKHYPNGLIITAQEKD